MSDVDVMDECILMLLKSTKRMRNTDYHKGLLHSVELLRNLKHYKEHGYFPGEETLKCRYCSEVEDQCLCNSDDTERWI